MEYVKTTFRAAVVATLMVKSHSKIWSSVPNFGTRFCQITVAVDAALKVGLTHHQIFNSSKY